MKNIYYLHFSGLRFHELWKTLLNVHCFWHLIEISNLCFCYRHRNKHLVNHYHNFTRNQGYGVNKAEQKRNGSVCNAIESAQKQRAGILANQITTEQLFRYSYLYLQIEKINTISCCKHWLPLVIEQSILN